MNLITGFITNGVVRGFKPIYGNESNGLKKNLKSGSFSITRDK